jgi:hypothetical protein
VPVTLFIAHGGSLHYPISAVRLHSQAGVPGPAYPEGAPFEDDGREAGEQTMMFPTRLLTPQFT